MANETPLRVLADRALNGRLNEFLCKWADAGASRRVAASLLAAELGVKISGPTVQRWTSEALADRTLEENGEAA